MLKNNCLSLTNPVWSGDTTVGRTFSKHMAKTFAKILLSTFKRLMGLYEPGSRGSLPDLWIKEMHASYNVGGKEPVVNASL